jgi:hypothetical protein
MMSVDIIEFNAANGKLFSEIDHDLISKGNQMIYYSSTYLSFLKCIIPSSMFYYIRAIHEDELLGVMPIAVQKEKNMVVANSLPFYGSYGGPLIFDNNNYTEIASEMLKKYLDFSSSINANIVNFIENPLDSLSIDNIEELGFEKIDERIGQVTIFPPLQSNMEEELMSLFHSKTRNMVRKGEKNDLRIELRNDDDSYKWLHQEHTKSITKLGGLPKPLEVFNALRSTFDNDCQLYIGYIDDKPVCGVLLLVYAQTIEYFTPVVQEEFRESQALSYLIYKIMTDLAQAGYKQWNWGGTWISQEGVYRFKKRWGSNDFPYRYYSKIGLDKDSLPPIQELKNDFPYYYLYKY